MTALSTPLIVVITALTVLVFVFGVRRLLGLRLSSLQTLIAGIIAFFSGSPIIKAIGGDSVTRDHRVLPGLWFVILGAVIALLVGMIFPVIAEALVPSGSLPGPVYLLRGMRTRSRRWRRYAHITRILLRRHLLPYQRGSRRSELATSEGRIQLARSLRLALEDGGVTFVKLGQVLSTRRDLLPDEFIQELSRLQENAPRVAWPDIEAVLRSDLGAEVDEVFATFSREPMAAASIAQVHAATLISGERVVAKIRRPGIDAVVEWDLDIIERIARRLQRSTDWARSVGVIELSLGFADALREELDLRIEEGNMKAIHATDALHGETEVRAPRPYESLRSANVLVMERLDGHSVGTAGAELTVADRETLARSLVDYLLRQVMIDGTFHADPHPGNILLLTDGRLGLLDFGSVGRIDASLRAALQRLLVALDRGDPGLLSDAFQEVVERPDDLDEVKLERALGRFMARHFGPGVSPDLRMFTDLFRIVSEHGVSIPPEMAAVFRAMATLEGTLGQLAPGFDTVEEARRFAGRHLAEQLTPESLRHAANDELLNLLPLLRRLPRRIDRIGASLETGRLGIKVRLIADDSDRRYLTGLLHQVLLTFLAAATGIMSVLMLGLNGGPSMTTSITLYAFFGYLVIAAILALRVLILVFRNDPGP